jgi:hypothetical protein
MYQQLSICYIKFVIYTGKCACLTEIQLNKNAMLDQNPDY